jgi:hypothetical protein
MFVEFNLAEFFPLRVVFPSSLIIPACKKLKRLFSQIFNIFVLWGFLPPETASSVTN